MILQCSECNARYLVPDHAIGVEGRTVRCANCNHSWFQKPSPEIEDKGKDELDKMLESITPPPEKPKPIPKGSNLPAKRREPMPAGVLTALIIGIAAAVALGLLIFRPALYGFPPSKGLELVDVVMIRLQSDKGPLYQISGKISNSAVIPMEVPTLRITLVDTDGKSLQYWDTQLEPHVLEPGQEAPFPMQSLEVTQSKASRFVVELGNPLELALRRKPPSL